MTLQEILSPERCVVVDTADKQESLALLAGLAARALPGTSREDVLASVLDREKAMSTRIAPGLALPHARLASLQRTLAAVLVTRRGISYDPSDEGEVHVIVMIVGGDAGHLDALAHLRVDVLRLAGIDQHHRSLLQVVLLQKVVVGLREYVDNGVADSDDVELLLAHSASCLVGPARTGARSPPSFTPRGESSQPAPRHAAAHGNFS